MAAKKAVHKAAPKEKPEPRKTTADEAIAIAMQLRLDQGRDKLVAFLESLKG